MNEVEIEVGDWVLVTKRSEDGLDHHHDYTNEEPLYLYNIGSGGKVIFCRHGDFLVEFYWGKYNYQQAYYKEQAKEVGVHDAKGGWYVDKNCLTVLPKGLTREEMKALGKVMI